MKKFTTSMLISLIIILSSVPAFASSEISVFVDGDKVSYQSAPIVQNGSTLVPLRQTFEALGATVDWDNETQTVTSNKDDTTVVLTIGNNTAYKNNSSLNISVAPQIIDGSTFVPLRFVAESFGADVSWDGSTKTVTIESNDIVTDLVDDVTAPPISNTNSLIYNTSTNYLTYDNKQYKIIDVDGGNLSGERQLSVAVDIGFGDREYWGLTNEYGQLVYVLAKKITLQDESTEPVKSNGRYYNDEAKVPGTESSDLDEGHVIADSLGGVSNAYNITPQNSTLNRHGDQAYMEEIIRKANGCTDFVATITYPSPNTQTPSKYKYQYVLKGNTIVDEFENKSPDNYISEDLNSDITDKLNNITSIDNSLNDKLIDSTSTDDNLNDKLIDNSSTDDTNDKLNDISSIDKNGNGIVTIAEAKSAGYKMPITSDHWLYPYMIDRDGDGMVGE